MAWHKRKNVAKKEQRKALKLENYKNTILKKTKKILKSLYLVYYFFFTTFC